MRIIPTEELVDSPWMMSYHDTIIHHNTGGISVVKYLKLPRRVSYKYLNIFKKFKNLNNLFFCAYSSIVRFTLNDS